MTDIRTCRDCLAPFVFTEGEKRFFEARGFTPPTRCPACRARKRAEREDAQFNSRREYARSGWR
jgi:hypothetical protein